MSAYVDCPECGTEKIPPTCAMCSACEIAARYDREAASLRATIEEQRQRIEAARKALDEADAYACPCVNCSYWSATPCLLDGLHRALARNPEGPPRRSTRDGEEG